MAARASARRHAQAAFEIARDNDEIDRWRADLRTMAATLSNPQALAILENPKIPLQSKMKLVEQVLPAVSGLALNLAYLLVLRGRLGLVRQMADEYERFADAYLGVEHAEVTTAVALDAATTERLAQRLGEITSAKVLLTTRVDPEIIGGFVARIGDRLVDGSTRARLKALGKALAEAR
ncbi:ATP synthase F1 subunit delta [Chloroflexota bacterium]